MRVNPINEPMTSSHDFNVVTAKAQGEADRHNDMTSNSSLSLGDKYFNELIEKTNKKLASQGTHLQLSVHDMSRQIVVKVVDTETDEVIREIPPEKFIDLVYNLCRQVGLIVDEKG
ncbi:MULTISPECIES: flagellar protein FlaG [Paenibacillus]|uniref:Flagellar biosynthesis protein FlaG n=1 Tax=Paenibacillus campinasensis TaxID=66347 RepID=A0ABW9TAA5_9BACL|nr:MULTISPECIES: flagellar protein FlaG [Paenibacillus]MUG68091.1 flagellar biosynthesis protein FlaG [Paenibacillus campinasensis]PAK51978.1 hypothetical protein CHH75_13160 [Paenibacillus sp. 7541]